jgi:HNH endonuclease
MTPIATGLCQCGCGEPTPVASRTVPAKQLVKGQPVRYLTGHHRRKRDLLVEDRGYVTPCHIWPGVPTPSGYGRLHHAGRATLAHRFFYEQASGPVPEGMDLDHLCRVPLCCNPDHLEPVTRAENVRRALAAEPVVYERDARGRIVQRVKALGSACAKKSGEHGSTTGAQGA